MMILGIDTENLNLMIDEAINGDVEMGKYLCNNWHRMEIVYYDS